MDNGQIPQPSSDGEDVSTTELLRRMGQALGRPARLVPVPVSWLKLAATLVGKVQNRFKGQGSRFKLKQRQKQGQGVGFMPDVVQRLCGSLQVDIEKTRRLLGWTPPVSLDEGLKKATEGLRV